MNGIKTKKKDEVVKRKTPKEVKLRLESIMPEMPKLFFSVTEDRLGTSKHTQNFELSSVFAYIFKMQEKKRRKSRSVHHSIIHKMLRVNSVSRTF